MLMLAGGFLTAIKQGILTPSTKAELEKIEAELGRLQGLIKARTAKVDNLALLPPNLKERFTALVANLATITNQHATGRQGARDAQDFAGWTDRPPSVCRWRGALLDGGSLRKLCGATAAGRCHK